MILYLVLSLSVLAHSCLASTDLNVGSICVDKDPGLRWLATMLSENSTIACSEQGSSAESEDRYWAAQVAKNASVVVFPSSSQDVSYTVQATRKTPLGIDYAFVSGGHSLTGASSSVGLVIDLKNLNRTTVLRDFPDPVTQLATPVVMYEGGVTSLGLQSATNGTGWTALTARASTVGMGGFSTGGGIGFMANAHGYALDRLIALEVVLPSGEIVFATKTNQHSDLFWAIQGGSGQFGIVTKFYQKAFETPSAVQVGFHVIADRSAAQSFRNIESFFRRHSDPFSLTYYALAYLPAGWPHAKPDEREHRTIRLIVTLWFDVVDHSNVTRQSSGDTFRTLLSGLDLGSSTEYTVPFANLTILSDSFFPMGYRRGFWGPQVKQVDEAYLSMVDRSFENYIAAMLAKGDRPSTSTWVLQYMLPGLNGHLPASDSDTAWPHSSIGHQTLFDPSWQNASSDGVATAFNELLYGLADSRAKPACLPLRSGSSGMTECDDKQVYHYPNYIKPFATGGDVWGNNTARLASLKQKYDPDCSIHNGRVFASQECVARGYANIF